MQLLCIFRFDQVKALIKLYITAEISNMKKNGLCWAVGLHSIYSTVTCCLYSLDVFCFGCL